MRPSLAALAVPPLILLSAPSAANHEVIHVHPDYRDVFEDEHVVGVDGPTDVEISPDGSLMLVTQKVGRLFVVEDFESGGGGGAPPPEARLALDLPRIRNMCTQVERGLSGAAFHADFPAEPWVYLYYTFDKFGSCDASGDVTRGPVNRFSRWRWRSSSGTVDASSEEVLFDTPRLTYGAHNSGDIAFGKDGTVYVTVGDGGARTRENEHGVTYPQAMDKLAGKIVRMTDTGEIPHDNPYTPQNGYPDAVRCAADGEAPRGSPKTTVCQEIYASGLRNPFRFAHDYDHDGVRFYINDVGRHTWEEVSEGCAGCNYGYPPREGPCPAKQDRGCAPPADADGYEEPVYWYHHYEADGGAVTGGAFVPADAGWPSSLTGRGAYLYAEYAYGGIHSAVPDGGRGCAYPECDPPEPPFEVKTLSSTRRVVSLQFGPRRGGRRALYYATRGFLPTDTKDGIRRIVHTGSANRAPTARVRAYPTSGPGPLLVNFDGAGSSDPDGDSLLYSWDFDGDGAVDSTDAVATHLYTEPGAHRASLTVRDGNGLTGTWTVQIEVGNTPPEPAITSPPEGVLFAVGDEFTLIGEATDAEDGALHDWDLEWEVRQHHNQHYHPFLDGTRGNHIHLHGAPAPEDFDASLTSYLEIILEATDSAGLSARVSRYVYPKKVNLTLETDPPGLYVTAYGDKIRTPARIVTWENHEFEVSADDQTRGGARYAFSRWSDGGGRARPFTAPPYASALAALFEEAEKAPAGGEATFVASDAASVARASPSRARAPGTDVVIDRYPRTEGLLKFHVRGVAGRRVARVALRLFVKSGGGDGGGNFRGLVVHRAASSDWDGGSVTWESAPPRGAGQLGSVSSVRPLEWAEAELGGAAVEGDGAVSFRVRSRSRREVAIDAAANPPQLVVAFDGGAEITSTATTSGAMTSTTAAGATSSTTSTGATSSTTSTGAMTTTAGGGREGHTLTLAATDDANVREDRPDRNLNNIVGRTELRVVAGWDVLLRFDLSALAGGALELAVLRIHCDGPSDEGGYVWETGSGWDEDTVTWNNAPGKVVGELAHLGRVEINVWVEVDVTGAVSDKLGGAVSFRIGGSGISDKAWYSSRSSGAKSPQLVVTYLHDHNH